MELEVSDSLSPIQIVELIHYSNSDPLILKTTQDSIRFRDKNTFEKWIKKNRKIYSLHDKSGKLYGVIWFGKKSIPNNFKLPEKFDKSIYEITFAVRIYGNARGLGHAKNFMNKTFNLFKLTDDFKLSHARGIWLITNSDNLPAISAYKRFGFRKIVEEEKTGRVLMVFDEN